jgi:ribonuclease T2
MAGRPSRLFLGALAILAALLWRPADAGTAGEFDFYVLALSWSPSWCATNDRDGRSPQCNGRRPYTFIAHGLWPQNERSWPEDCPSTEPDRVPDALARSMADIIPSAGLAGHEWRKHGTCSGLTQPIYFRTLRAAFQKIKLPPVIFDGRIDRRLATDDIEKLMIRANQIGRAHV